MWDKREIHPSIRASSPSTVHMSSVHKQRSSLAHLVCLLARHDTATQVLQAWFPLKIGSFNKLIIAQNHYPFQAFVLVRFCCLVMTTATFAPPLNEVKLSLSNAVFSVRSLLLWPTLELEIPPSNEGIHHCIRVKKRESDLNMYRERNYTVITM